MTQPFLTILTRCYKRPKALRECLTSIAFQSDQDIEHILIKDTVGQGLLWANTQIAKSKDTVHGQYVMVLDDDDYLTDPDLVKRLKEQVLPDMPAAVIVKGKIKDNTYPTCWKEHPKRGQIGSCNLIARQDIYKKHCHKWQAPKAGDFFYADSIFSEVGDQVDWWDTLAFQARISEGKPELPQLAIDTRIPYVTDKQLGAAYNIAMETVDDWVLFLDHDVLNVNPHYFEACLSAIQRVGHRAGWITCRTNRIGCPHQLDKTAPQGDDIMAHMAHAGKLWQQYGDKLQMIDTTQTIKPANKFSGLFILTHKEAWEKAGKFKDGFLGVDNDYYDKIIKAGYKSYVLPGIYVYHIYHNKKKWAWG